MAVQQLNALLKDNGIDRKDDLCVLNMLRYGSRIDTLKNIFIRVLLTVQDVVHHRGEKS